MNDWKKLAALAHEALLDCKRATERGSQPPSARLELVRDYSTPAIVALQNAFKAERKAELEIKRVIWAGQDCEVIDQTGHEIKIRLPKSAGAIGDIWISKSALALHRHPAGAPRRPAGFPLADCPTMAERPAGVTRRNLRCEATGEFRAPKKGEWYLSGALPEGYKAPADLNAEYHIARLIPLGDCPKCHAGDLIPFPGRNFSYCPHCNFQRHP